jgi:superfamily I DNA/RNA helicase/mRNA-degrading endonuclease RelE of RelBE toxin-antitoxin system
MVHGSLPVKLAISDDFLFSFSRIPRNQQTKVLEFVNKFRSDPTLPGINYEKIQGARDPNLRSVRIDQAYRGIVLRPEKGNVYVLLWVDHHDKAYSWATNKVCGINPETGSVQIVDVTSVPVGLDMEPPAGEEPKKGLFDGVHDRHLIRMGIPEIQLPLVRSIRTEEELDRAVEVLPQEGAEALYMLASGYSVEDAFRELEITAEPETVDTSDFSKALDAPDSRRRFFVVEDDLELSAILEAPLEKWRVFLHPSQRKLVERDWNGPVRVLGGAGTGKTVAAMHRARWLALNRFTGRNDRILFTTFTRNLAADIRENLTKICPQEALARIEVVNLDKWVSDFLKRNGYRYDIDYGPRIMPLWETALSLAPSELRLDATFYREEWERVVQPSAATSMNEYIKAPRVGRGIRLNRKDRLAVWPVFEEYRALLNENGLREAIDAMRDARLLLESKGDILAYKAVIVDEAQDMGAEAFRLIRQMIPGGDRKNDLFIVGDAHQRIYRHKVVLNQCGVSVRGRSRKLRINYRTTEENRRWAVNLLEGLSIDDLDGGQDDQKGYKSLLHGLVPQVRIFSSFAEEVAHVAAYLKDMEANGQPPSSVCLVARTNELLKQYEAALKELGMGTYFIRRSEAEDLRVPGLRLATMHRVKGLEFDRVIIAGVNEGMVPYEGVASSSSDPVVQRESEVQERALLYVAATRAKKEVLVTTHGTPSRFLKS